MSKKILMLVAGFLAGLSLLLIGASLIGQPAGFRGSSIDPADAAGDFALLDQDRQLFRLSDQRGQVVLVFFGFISCPDVCPATLAEFKKVRSELGDQANQVRMVFITVDPDRDTPEGMRAYLNLIDPEIVGLTGEPGELEEVWKAYGVFVEKQVGSAAGGGYEVTHTARVYAIDRQGKLRLTYPFGTPVEDLVHDIRVLLKEKVG